MRLVDNVAEGVGSRRSGDEAQSTGIRLSGSGLSLAAAKRPAAPSALDCTRGAANPACGAAPVTMGHGTDSVTDHDPRCARRQGGPQRPGARVAGRRDRCRASSRLRRRRSPTHQTNRGHESTEHATSLPLDPESGRHALGLAERQVLPGWSPRRRAPHSNGALARVARKWQLTVQQLDIARLTIDWLSTQDLPPWAHRRHPWPSPWTVASQSVRVLRAAWRFVWVRCAATRVSASSSALSGP